MTRIDSYLLTLSCLDRPGIVAAISSYIASFGGNILEAQQFDDAETGRFFMRVEFALQDSARYPDVRRGFDALAEQFAITWRMRPRAERQRTLILVSKFDHCLVDLLYRLRIGELEMDVVGIVSNHPRQALMTPLIDDVPFHYLPVTPDTRNEQEARIKALIEETGAELIILARYMQILSDALAAYLSGRCINIHHSFLPGFKGAKPYHQAHARGVKMIGATAHYVTSDLDEGPIIAQDVEGITHADRPDALIIKGRDIERRVLAKAVQLHLEDRVLLNGAKTVVFRD
ncbi:formyltetrahydrofolate deformylase [Sphingomonas turrisvirgatae]|uniref:Formyltetrahydrofolate deformylase n=1 Tax=Sphingomonas turrisvirgatae TaxID=1888892 RepID=A0A1E3LR96_9SPHN|nr:formyltetrahydrofolate deformylase [Sphingomonas turrisvirgatae]ODP36253.1 formyltetrahydrofolate deformylase [Sphingomonas turrisvirgatae]